MTTRPLIKWTLIASLALNVAVGAAVVGAVVAGDQWRIEDRRDGARRGAGPAEIGALARGLDRTDRRALFQALRADGRLRDGRERMRAARDRVAQTLTAEPFDPATFEAALSDIQRLQGELSQAGIDALTGIIAGLSPAERAALATDLTRSRRHLP